MGTLKSQSPRFVERQLLPNPCLCCQAQLNLQVAFGISSELSLTGTGLTEVKTLQKPSPGKVTGMLECSTGILRGGLQVARCYGGTQQPFLYQGARTYPSSFTDGELKDGDARSTTLEELWVLNARLSYFCCAQHWPQTLQLQLHVHLEGLRK